MKLLAICAAAFLATAAHAENEPPFEPCKETKGEMAAQVKASHGETPQVSGIDRMGDDITIYANRFTGTWTLVVSPLGMPSCVGGYGREFIDLLGQPT